MCVCVRNSKIKYFCVYKSEYKKKILHVVEKILETASKIHMTGRWLRKFSKYQRRKENLGKLDQRRKLCGWKQTPSTHIHDVHMWTNTADKARARPTHKKITTYSRQGTCSTHPQKNNNSAHPQNNNYNPFTGCHDVCIGAAITYVSAPPPEKHTRTYIRPQIFRRIGCARARAKNNITKISNHGENKKEKK